MYVHITATLVRLRLLSRLGVCLLRKPESELLVVPPVVLVELVGSHLLHDVSRLAVKDEEERLVREVSNLCLRRRGLDVVASGQVELWLDVVRLGGVAVGPGRDEGRVERLGRGEVESQLGQVVAEREHAQVRVLRLNQVQQPKEAVPICRAEQDLLRRRLRSATANEPRFASGLDAPTRERGRCRVG